MSERGPRAELVLYATEDGSAQFFLRAEDGTIWLSQAELADLFQSSVPNINIHIRNVLAEGELSEIQTVKDDLIVRTEGTRRVRRTVKLYNLDMILAVGYRVKSPRGAQFRQWATTHLREYLIKGFVLFALSVDHADDDGQATGQFFAEVQNKMFFAVTGRTAAELIVQHADAGQPNMALPSWRGGRVRKADVTVAKNYLNAEELEHLNRIVSLFLDFAELRAPQRQGLRMADWRGYGGSFMEFNEQPLLHGPGRMGHKAMAAIVHERYAQFDATRKKAEALEADRQESRELEQVEHKPSSQKKRGAGSKDAA